jgi:hypothetical protein
MAQQRAGTIYGKVLDAEKNPLPGVTVTLNGPQMAPLTTVTSETGMYRFPSTPPGSEYVIKAELQGFKSIVQPGIVVTIGASTEINLTLEVGKLEEQVTVTAASPVVDPKKTTQAMSVNKEEMQSLPSARDPWVIMQLAPSIMVDRENVGGNESGQQSGFIGKGDTSGSRISGNQGANNIWAVDGIDITDPAALGGSALYYDFDMFEELNITTGGAADVTIQTGGIALNMVTRRGGNKMSLAGRFYLTDNFFQSSNLTQSLKDQGVINVNKIQYIKDYGFNAGGPILKDKLWWWGAYGVQDIFVYTITGNKDQTLLNNYNIKLNAQLLANNRFEALVTSGAKEKFGRDSNFSSPEGNHQTGKYHWGSPIVKLQDEHVFGNNLYLSLKYSFNDAGFGWRPMTDEGVNFPIVWDEGQNKFVPYKSGMNASWGSYGVSRPRNNYQLNASYFNDTFLGLSHEIKVGAEYSHKIQSTIGSDTGYIQGFDVQRNYVNPNLDVDADGTLTVGEMAGWQRLWLYRREGSSDVTEQAAGYIQDTITKGNFTLTLGLRFDRQWPSSGAYLVDAVPDTMTAWQTVFNQSVSDTLKTYLTNQEVHATKGIANIVNGDNRPYQWNTWSPRIGLTWDVAGDGKTVAKLALSQYGDIMGVGWYASRPSGIGGGIAFWWKDNGDNIMTFDEMYWNYSDRKPAGTAYVPYLVFDNNGNLTATANTNLTDAPFYTDTDAYVSGAYWGYEFLNPDAPILYGTGDTTYFLNRGAQSSSRTREILLTVEREIFPDFAASVSATYRRYDNNQIGLRYYPPEHSDEYPLYTGPAIIDPRDATPGGGTWYVQAGTVPDNYIIGGTWALVGGVWTNTGGTTYSSGDAAGKPYYLPSAEYPTTGTRYGLIRKNDNWYHYFGIDLVLTKRLSNRWFMNTSFTWQNQKVHWGKDNFNITNKWAFDNEPFGDWGGGASGKVAVLMYTPWMFKFSALYQLPYGFDLSGTFNAREGWKIPVYFNLYVDQTLAPNYSAGRANTIYKQPYTQDSLPTFYQVNLRLEKRINIGAGRLYLMADVFNLLNSNMPIRSYNKYDGNAYYTLLGGNIQQYSSGTYAFNGRLNEILNPRVWRFGARFEF